MAAELEWECQLNGEGRYFCVLTVVSPVPPTVPSTQRRSINGFEDKEEKGKTHTKKNRKRKAGNPGQPEAVITRTRPTESSRAPSRGLPALARTPHPARGSATRALRLRLRSPSRRPRPGRVSVGRRCDGGLRGLRTRGCPGAASENP